jgi:transcriptional regulator with XRE-family HTH domain
MAERVSPVVRGRRLAAELRRLREGAGLTIKEVADGLECSTAKVSRFENGQVKLRVLDARALLDLYRVPEPEREQLLDLVRQARTLGWWHAYADLLPNGAETFIGLEDEADGIDVHAVSLVPGLLQTESYAWELNASFEDLALDVAARYTELHQTRQQILTRPDPVLLHVVIDESALRRRIGGPQVMARQFRHLIEAADRRNITLQVLPFAAGAHQGAAYSYNIAAFADPADPKVVYVGMLNDCVYHTDAEHVGRYEAAFTQAALTALDPAASVDFLDRLAREAEAEAE